MRNSILAGLVFGCSASSAAAQSCGGWKTTILNPSGIQTAGASCVGSVFQGGAVWVGGQFRPVAWSGGAESIVYFSAPQAQSGHAYATFGDSLGGVDQSGRPCLWRGPAFEYVSLETSRSGLVLGMTQDVQVGFTFADGDRARIWRGTPGSGTDLAYPAVLESWQRSYAQAAAGLQAVGYCVNNWGESRAVLWPTSGESAAPVVLHPGWATSSVGLATDGVRQGGNYRIYQNPSRAAIWSGSAESVVTLGPEGAVASSVEGMSLGVQVGFVGSRAFIWRGTPESGEDISPGWAATAFARGVWSDGERLEVVGACTSWYGQTFAVLWTYEPPRACCSADLNQDGSVDANDLGLMLARWGFVAPNTLGDLNDDWAVNGADVGALLGAWGACAE
jgi:hypothetical protein